jgi:molybdate transport system ATP-binding protein
VDQVTRRKLQHELARLHKRLKLPMILVTHDLEEACRLAGRMCILHRGTTLQSGPTLEVMARPVSALVARLVGWTNIFRGRVRAHRPGSGHTLLSWLDRTLECRHAPQFAPGEVVDWVIPPQNVLLHQRVRPSRGERENPVRGVVADFVVLGDSASVTLALQGHPDTPLTFTVPAHVAMRNRLAAGESIGVSLLADAIHLMSPGAVPPVGADGE